MTQTDIDIDIAWSMSLGQLPSPQRVGRSWLIAMRISGTGVAARPALDELAYRPASIWCTARMAARWLGQPVVLQHPEKGELDPAKFRESVLGSIVYTWWTGRYKENGPEDGDELWCIARTFSDELAANLMNPDGSLILLDTSPAVMLQPEAGSRIELDDGTHLLIEPEPTQVDHLAVVLTPPEAGFGGVWTKGSDNPEDAGIPTTEDGGAAQPVKELSDG